MEYGVTIQVDGQDILAGMLYAHVRRGIESASFKYEKGYLSRNISGAPLITMRTRHRRRLPSMHASGIA